MISFNLNKIKFFKKEVDFKKKNFFFNTNIYWMVAMLTIFLAIVICSFFGYTNFVQMSQDVVSASVSHNTRIPIVNKDKITKVLNYFTIREAKTNQIINSPSPVVDPSL